MWHCPEISSRPKRRHCIGVCTITINTMKISVWKGGWEGRVSANTEQLSWELLRASGMRQQERGGNNLPKGSPRALKMRRRGALETLGYMTVWLRGSETWGCLSMRLWKSQKRAGTDLLSVQGTPDWVTGCRGQQPKGDGIQCALSTRRWLWQGPWRLKGEEVVSGIPWLSAWLDLCKQTFKFN